MIVGDVYIGAGETDAVRFIARAAKELVSLLPLIIIEESYLQRFSHTLDKTSANFSSELTSLFS